MVFMCILGIVFAFSVRNFAMREKYIYSMNYYVTNYEFAKLTINISSLDTDAKMAESCKILLESDLTMDTLSEMLIEKYGEDYLSRYFEITDDGESKYIEAEKLRSCINIDIATEGVAVLKVDVTTDNPYLSQDIGEFLSFLAPNVVYYLVGVDYISPFENARLNVDYGIFEKKKVLAAGAAFGLLVSVLIIVIYSWVTKDIIMDNDDIKKLSGTISLGNIPYYDYKMSGQLKGKD